jgi:starch synthase (maltosyl-transferring)
MTRWPAHAARARDMGFDWLYLNPFHYPGFSGSMYAVKDYGRVDPLLLPPDHPDHHYEDTLRGDGGIGLLGDIVTEIRALGLSPMMDLVVNHTARDAHLVREHPEWYARDAAGEVKSPSAIDPADARNVTVWGDLAELDHAGSADREGLWAHLEGLVRRYARLGFRGFRCDAAYHVPAALWQRLIAAAREEAGEQVLFFAETLGARLEQIDALRPAGFDFIFNSSKWWDYVEPWCLEQQQAHASLAPSVSFPESHDTPRLWAETGGSAALQRQRYAFAAAFATGVMMPVGYEYGFSRPLDVAKTRAEDWEEPADDLGAFVARTHAMKRAHPVLGAETAALRSTPGDPVLLLEKRGDGAAAWIVVNTRADAAQAPELPHDILTGSARLLRPFDERDGEMVSPADRLQLGPAEVIYIVGM